MGGQTALNLAVALAERRAPQKYNVELIEAKLDAIKQPEDRELFKQAMKSIGPKTPPCGVESKLDDCIDIANEIGEFPLITRPAFTLGGLEVVLLTIRKNLSPSARRVWLRV